jgi:hypothetical protein
VTAFERVQGNAIYTPGELAQREGIRAVAPQALRAGLRDEIRRLRTAADDHAAGLMDEGKDAERAYGRVEAYDRILDLMNHLAEG